MRFRTEIEPIKTKHSIGHDTPLLMLGSCFTDNIGERLDIDGFNVIHNPAGPLYNPMSIASCLNRALENRLYTDADLTHGPNGMHCLDYASRYSGADGAIVIEKVNEDFGRIADRIGNQLLRTIIVTFGSAFVFERHGRVVGNCHKFPASEFVRRRLSVDEITAAWSKLLKALPDYIHVVFTVSPIRHTADGLHGNQLSKSILLLAVDKLCNMFPDCTDYFPSYEIMLDDLRDYRFYASDMKHPSDVAVDYIYELFSNTYMTPKARTEAAESRRRYKASQHRQIL